MEMIGDIRAIDELAFEVIWDHLFVYFTYGTMITMSFSVLTAYSLILVTYMLRDEHIEHFLTKLGWWCALPFYSFLVGLFQMFLSYASGAHFLGGSNFLCWKPKVQISAIMFERKLLRGFSVL